MERPRFHSTESYKSRTQRTAQSFGRREPEPPDPQRPRLSDLPIHLEPNPPQFLCHPNTRQCMFSKPRDRDFGDTICERHVRHHHVAHVPIQEHSRPQLFNQLPPSLRTHFLRRLTSFSQTVSPNQRPMICIAAQDHPATRTRTLLCGRDLKGYSRGGKTSIGDYRPRC